jgi:mono/diheme cytochrome c family protein
MRFKTVQAQLKRIPYWAWGLLVVLAVGGAAAASWLPRYTTSNPEYCLTCHGENGGLPNRGIASLVHPPFSEVRCVDCHSKPHQLLYEGYRRGFMSEPERIGPNCISCHEEMTERLDEEGFRFNVLGVRAAHKLHVDQGARCVDCHYNIAHDLRPAPTNRPRMEYCAECHAVTVEACSKCHPAGVPEGPMPVIRPAGVLGDGRSLYRRYCAECHGEDGKGVGGVELRSKEFLEREGLEALRRIAQEGHGGMPAFGQALGGPFTDDEIRALAAYLKLSAEEIAVGGQTLYEGYCSVCHGPGGEKIPKVRLGDPEFLTSLGHEEILRVIQEGRGGMPAFSKARGGPLSFEETLAVARYLDELAGVAVRSPATLFSDSCVQCHGPDGARIPTANLASKEFLSQKSDEEMTRAIAEGIGGMPALGREAGGALSDDEIRALVRYLKQRAGLLPLPSPPQIPHSLVGMDRCFTCHGPSGIKPVPADHEGRTEDTCQVCHKPKE